MRKLFFVFLYLFVLSSLFALRTCWTSGDPAESAADHHFVSTEPQMIELADEAEQIPEGTVYAAKKGST